MIRVATRGGPRALPQAEEMAARLGEIGGKRLFGREVERALLAGNAEMALHSPNDLPAELPDGLLLAVYPERQAPHDMLVRSLR